MNVDPAILLFLAGVLTGIALCLLTLSAQHIRTALRYIRHQLHSG